MNRKQVVWALVAGLLMAAGLMLGGGCDVQLSPEYSQLLDRTALLSEQTAQRARDGRLSDEQMVQALTAQAAVWKRFQDARDGVADYE